MKNKDGRSSVKDEILRTAESFFLTHGYEKTTFQMIADELNITKGLITYYFRSKYGILDKLMSDHILAIQDYVCANPPANYNRYLHYCIVYIIFFRETMKTEKNWQFFYRQRVIFFGPDNRFEVFLRMYRIIAEDFHKELNEEDIHMMTVMLLGAHTRIFEEFQNDAGRSKLIDKYCHYIAYAIGILAKLDEATIQKNIARAFEYVNAHSLSGFSLFR